VLKLQRDESSGRVNALLGGMDRFRVRQLAAREPFMVAEVEYLYEVKVAPNDELKAHVLALVNSIKDLVQLNPLFKEELSLLIGQGITFEDPGRLADLAAFMTTAAGDELQEVLETLEVQPRLEKVLRLLNKELDISRLQAKIGSRSRSGSRGSSANTSCASSSRRSSASSAWRRTTRKRRWRATSSDSDNCIPPMRRAGASTRRSTSSGSWKGRRPSTT